jgi:hypothetical protein
MALTCLFWNRARYVAQTRSLSSLKSLRKQDVWYATRPAKPEWLGSVIGSENYVVVEHLMIRGTGASRRTHSPDLSPPYGKVYRRHEATREDLANVGQLFTLEDLTLVGDVFTGDCLKLLYPLRHSLKVFRE